MILEIILLLKGQCEWFQHMQKPYFKSKHQIEKYEVCQHQKQQLTR